MDELAFFIPDPFDYEGDNVEIEVFLNDNTSPWLYYNSNERLVAKLEPELPSPAGQYTLQVRLTDDNSQSPESSDWEVRIEVIASDGIPQCKI